MSIPGVAPLDAAFVLSVTGAAMIFPPLALFVAAAYFIASAIIEDRRMPPKAA